MRLYPKLELKNLAKQQRVAREAAALARKCKIIQEKTHICENPELPRQ